MNKKDAIKVTNIIMSNHDKFDMILILKHTFPNLAKEIDQEVKHHTDDEDLEDAIVKKAEELFVLDGNDIIHFCLPGSDHSDYFRKARKILNNN